MAIRFENPAEAFAALALAVIGADERITEDESNIFDSNLKSFEMFKEYDDSAYTETISRVLYMFGKNWKAGHINAFTREEIDILTAASAEILNPAQRRDALQLLAKIADIGGRGQEEQAVLDQIQEGLQAVVFHDPAEAFMGIALAIIGADEQISEPESHALDNLLKHKDIFKNMDDAAYTETISRVLDMFSKDWKAGNIKAFTRDEITSLIAAANRILSPRDLVKSVHMAAEIADMDKRHEREQAVLDQLQHGLNAVVFHDPAEAFMGIALAVIGADGEITEAESHALDTYLKSMKIFKNYDDAAYTKMISLVLDMFDKDWKAGHINPFTPEELGMLITGARRILSPDERKQALEMAHNVARLDGLSKTEQAVLDRLQSL